MVIFSEATWSKLTLSKSVVPSDQCLHPMKSLGFKWDLRANQWNRPMLITTCHLYSTHDAEFLNVRNVVDKTQVISSKDSILGA